MSVAEKAIVKLAEIFENAPVSFNSVTGTANIGGRVVPVENFDRFYGEKYDTMIKSIDWNRVALEARGRCLKLHPDKDEFDMPCGECLEAAMLVRETWPDW